MAGRNFLFVPGPTNTPDRILRAMHVAMEDHRSSDFPKLAAPVLENLKKIFKTTTGQAFIFPASGTGAWEASLSQHAVARATGCSPPGSACSATSGSTWPSGSASRWTCSTPSGARARRSSGTRRRSPPTRATRSRPCCSPTTRRPPASPATWRACARRSNDAKHPALLMVDGVSSIAQHRLPHGRVGRGSAPSPGRRRVSCCRPASASCASSQKALGPVRQGQAAAGASSTSAT